MSAHNALMTTAHLSLACLTFDLLSSDYETAGSDTPMPLHILPVGEFASGDGRPAKETGGKLKSWNLTAQGAQALIAEALARKGNTDIVIDYEHQTLLAEKNGLPAPAAGWISPAALAFDPNVGLIGVPKWTVKAKQYIADAEYRYLSPVFTYDPRTGEPKQLLHIALTNDPALGVLREVGMAALSAHFNLSLEPSPPQPTKKEQSMSMTQLMAALKLKPDAAESSAVEAVTALTSQISQQETQITALKAENETLKANQFDPVQHIPMTEHKTVADQLAALTAKAEQDEHGALMTAALSDGRILPPNEPYWRKQPLAALKAFLTDAKPLVAALKSNQTQGNPPVVNATGEAQLSEDELAVCKSLGVSADAFASSKTELANQ